MGAPEHRKINRSRLIAKPPLVSCKSLSVITISCLIFFASDGRLHGRGLRCDSRYVIHGYASRCIELSAEIHEALRRRPFFNPFKNGNFKSFIFFRITPAENLVVKIRFNIRLTSTRISALRFSSKRSLYSGTIPVIAAQRGRCLPLPGWFLRQSRN